MSRVEAASTAGSSDVVLVAPSAGRFRAWTVCFGAVAVLAMGLGYAVLVAPGLPYDEPSHWGYVRWLVEHGSLPVLGEWTVFLVAHVTFPPGVTL
jgi:hypothetical protein